MSKSPVTRWLAAKKAVVKKAMDAGIPVVTIDSGLAEEVAVSFIATDNPKGAGEGAKALADGVVAGQIAADNAARAKRLATRKQPITGVSMFPLAVEPAVDAKPRPAVPARAGLAPIRDSAVFETLRDRVTAAGKPAVFLACLGARRDFGGREQFTSNLLLVGGFATPESEGGTADEIVAQVQAAGANMVVLCSSAKVYAAQAMDVARALKASGVETVFLAGRKKEVGDEAVDTVIDGEIFDGMDVVAFSNATLDRLGAAK